MRTVDLQIMLRNRAMMDATGMKNLVSCFVDHCQGAQAVTVRFHTGFGFSYSGDCRPSEDFVRIGKGSTVLVHEATFDDAMDSDAKAKKHSTMSEAIGVASAMGAKRLILTHFSQRYQKLPSLGALNDAEVIFNDPQPSKDAADLVDVMENSKETHSSTGAYEPVPEQHMTTTLLTTDRISPSSPLRNSPPPSPTKHELKVAIAFDFLRVRVGDIAHIEKFTPTLQRLFEILEENEKVKAQENPGEVARRKKEEQKQQKRENQERIAREKQEAKARRNAGSRTYRRNKADNKRYGDLVLADLTEDSADGKPQRSESVFIREGETDIEHADRTKVNAEEAGIIERTSSPFPQRSQSPVLQDAAK
ncbi:MAG: hypothetical protein Q9209_001767 [Squamulea sp. 1 TL-2023]